MKKYQCKCNDHKCNVEVDVYGMIPQYCACYTHKNTDWQEVKEEKAEEIINLPSWCKVGEWVYDGFREKYRKIIRIDMTIKGCPSPVIFFDEDADCLCPSMQLNSIGGKYLTQARLRPFNNDEMRDIVGKVVEYKKDGYLGLITGLSKNYNELADKEELNFIIGLIRYDCDYLLRDFTFPNGSPCGVYEHLENGEWVKG